MARLPDLVSPQRRRDLVDASTISKRARGGFSRVRSDASAILQTAAAAAIAYLISGTVLGHVNAFFAPVAAIITLGATRGQRVREGLELVFGVAMGVGIGELLIRLIGTGAPQVALVVAMALSAAFLLWPGERLSTEAAVSATLVATVATDTSAFPPTRFIDALVGGGVALVFSQLLFPVHPVRVVREAVQSILGDLAGALDETARALERREIERAKRALVDARHVSDDWREVERALDAGREAVRYAPPRRRLKSRFADHQDVGLPLDLTVRDARMLARGAVRALTIGEEVPRAVTTAIHDLARAARALESEFAGADVDEVEVRDAALEATEHATAAVPDGEHISTTVLVGHVQAASADMLRSIGLERDEAHSLVGDAAVSGADGNSHEGQ